MNSLSDDESAELILLDNAFAFGRNYERIRVVALLERLLADDFVSIWDDLDNSQTISKEQLLTRIKGETK